MNTNSSKGNQMKSRRNFLTMAGLAGAATAVSTNSLATLPEIVHQDSFDTMPPLSPPDGRPYDCLLYTSPSPRDKRQSRMPSSA